MHFSTHSVPQNLTLTQEHTSHTGARYPSVLAHKHTGRQTDHALPDTRTETFTFCVHHPFTGTSGREKYRGHDLGVLNGSYGPFLINT